MSNVVYINMWWRTEDGDVPYCDRYNIGGFDLWLCLQDKVSGHRQVVGGHYHCGFMHGFYYEYGGKVPDSQYEVTHYWIRDSAKPDLPEY